MEDRSKAMEERAEMRAGRRHSSDDSAHAVIPATPLWVLDTNVVLDWLVFSDPGVLAISAWIETGRARLVTRTDCRSELIRVLAYPRLAATSEVRSAALVRYDRYAKACPHAGTVQPGAISPVLPICRDADDQKFLELARDASAQWLISKDKQVLKLARRLGTLGLFDVVHPVAASRVLCALDAPTVS